MKLGVFFLVKKWTFHQRRVHYVSINIFILHFTYLGGCAYAPNAPPACGPVLYKSTVIYTVWQLFNELKHKASQHVFIYCWNWCGLSAEMHRSSTLLKQWLKCLTVDRIRLCDQSARGPNRHRAFTYWLSCGFTSKSTQNGSFRRRFPKPISWPGMDKNKSNTTKARIHQSKEMYYNTKN